MENASKALIIAGAILLSILLISLGIMIFNQAQDTVNNSGMSEAEITAFNNKFLKYEGTQSGTVAKTLVNEVLVANEQLDSKISVSIAKKGNGSAQAATTKPNTSAIDKTQQYTIEISYTNGRVSSIVIK